MRKNQRIWWLVVVLFVLLNGLALQRPRIAEWGGKNALRAVSQDNDESAERWLNFSRLMAPDSPTAEVARARKERRAGDFEQSKRHLSRAAYLGADAAILERERWLGLAQSGGISTAAPQLSSLLESAGNDIPEVCESFSIGYMRMRDFSSAIALLDGWANEFPDDPRPHSWMGHIFADLQDTPAAEKAFRTALAIDPAHGSSALGLGQLLTDTKRTSESIEYLKIAFADPKLQSKAAVPLATSLRSQSQSEEADNVLRQALEQFPDNHAILVERASSLVEKGDFQAAVTLLQPLIDSGTLRREVHYAYATGQRGLGKIDEATKHFEYATTAATALAEANRKITKVSESPEDVELRFQIGNAQLIYGNIEDGILWLQSVLQLNPEHEPTHRLLADYYQKKAADSPKYISLAQFHRRFAGSPPPAEPPTQAPELSEQTPATAKGSNSENAAGEN